MDKITHEIRRANWKSIIEQCQQRPKGLSIKQWLRERDISEKSYYYWLRKIRKETYEQMNPAMLSDVRQNCPVTFAEVPIHPVSIPEAPNIPFQADAVIHTGALTIGLSNSISETLLKQMMEVVTHVS